MTARHAADLGFLPVVVEDACGVVEGEAAERSLASLDYSLMSYRATTAQVVEALSGAWGDPAHLIEAGSGIERSAYAGPAGRRRETRTLPRPFSRWRVCGSITSVIVPAIASVKASSASTASGGATSTRRLARLTARPK
jgi:hypothetical protein